jgi:hypothetical protein
MAEVKGYLTQWTTQYYGNEWIHYKPPENHNANTTTVPSQFGVSRELAYSQTSTMTLSTLVLSPSWYSRNATGNAWQVDLNAVPWQIAHNTELMETVWISLTSYGITCLWRNGNGQRRSVLFLFVPHIQFHILNARRIIDNALNALCPMTCPATLKNA